MNWFSKWLKEVTPGLSTRDRSMDIPLCYLSVRYPYGTLINVIHKNCNVSTTIYGYSIEGQVMTILSQKTGKCFKTHFDKNINKIQLQ
jgi:hypothetical protein